MKPWGRAYTYNKIKLVREFGFMEEKSKEWNIRIWYIRVRIPIYVLSGFTPFLSNIDISQLSAWYVRK